MLNLEAHVTSFKMNKLSFKLFGAIFFSLEEKFGPFKTALSRKLTVAWSTLHAGTTRPARHAGAFTSFLPSRIRHPHRGVDWCSGLRARSTNRSHVATTAGALEASKTPASARSSGSATKIGNRKSGKTKASAATASTGANIDADSRSGSLDCSPRKVLVTVESPAKARTISGILEKARNRDGSSMDFGGYTVDACNGHVRDFVGKRRDLPPELKQRTKKWDVIGVDVVSRANTPLYITCAAYTAPQKDNSISYSYGISEHTYRRSPCMVIHTAKLWINRVRLPVLHVIS